jgi:hypothetical protein
VISNSKQLNSWICIDDPAVTCWADAQTDVIERSEILGSAGPDIGLGGAHTSAEGDYVGVDAHETRATELSPTRAL